MKKSTEARLTHIEDMLQVIHDHLMHLHRLAEDALAAEIAIDNDPPVSSDLLRLPHPPDMN